MNEYKNKMQCKKPVVHFEIGCDDLSETVSFCKEIFGWDITLEGNSAAINTDANIGVPGHMTELGHEPRKHINIYIETDSITQDLETIESKGGEKLIGPIELPDGRRFAWFKDIAGNTGGLTTPLKDPLDLENI